MQSNILTIGKDDILLLDRPMQFTDHQISKTGFVDKRMDRRRASPSQMGSLYEIFLTELLYQVFSQQWRVPLTAHRSSFGEHNKSELDVMIHDQAQTRYVMVSAKHGAEAGKKEAGEVMFTAFDVLDSIGPRRLKEVFVYLVAADYDDTSVEMSARRLLEHRLEKYQKRGWITFDSRFRFDWLNRDNLEELYLGKVLLVKDNLGASKNLRIEGYPGIVLAADAPQDRNWAYHWGYNLIDNITNLADGSPLETWIDKYLTRTTADLLVAMRKKDTWLLDEFAEGASSRARREFLRDWCVGRYQKIMRNIRTSRSLQMSLYLGEGNRAQDQDRLTGLQQIIARDRKDFYKDAHELKIAMFPDQQIRWVLREEGESFALMPQGIYTK